MLSVERHQSFGISSSKMYMSGSKKLTLKICNHTIDMKETKKLHGYLMLLTRSNRNIHQKNTLGNYEFTLTPRAIFAPNKLIHDVEKLASMVDQNDHNELSASYQQDSLSLTYPANVKIIIVVDGMVLVQKLTKNKRVQ